MSTLASLWTRHIVQGVNDIYTTVLRACLPGLHQMVLSVSKVLSNERGQSRCHLAGEKELFGSLVYMHLLNP